MLLNLGMGALGALLGVLIAWSASPVVATAMPLLFGLLGGASSFSLLKMDLAKPNNQMKVRLVGSSLLSCCSGCLVALLLAVLAKGWVLQRGTLANFYEFKPQQIASVSDGIEKIVLRKRLQLLGATADEIRVLFDKMAMKPNFKAIVDRLESAAASLIAANEDERKVQTAVSVNQSNLRLAYNLAKTFLVEKAFFDSTADPTITEARFRYLTDKLYRQLGTVLLGGFHWNTDSIDLEPKAITALANFADALLINKDTAVVDPWVGQDMNELIKIVAAIRETGGTRDVNLVARAVPDLGPQGQLHLVPEAGPQN